MTCSHGINPESCDICLNESYIEKLENKMKELRIQLGEQSEELAITQRERDEAKLLLKDYNNPYSYGN